MIMTTKGFVQMVGSTPELCADISNILASFRKAITDKYSKDAAEDFMAKIVEVSAMRDEELKAETQALKKELKESKKKSDAFINELMNMIMKGIGE